ncbi:MAG: MFS transporter [Armatimonadetes bacterium]|nr:MFS transporter [Armatimonadota bacterium]
MQRLRAVFGEEHRPFWLIVLNGVLWRLSAEVFDGRRIVAAFLTQLLGKEWVVGVALAIQPGVTSFPQLYESYVVSDGRERMPYYRVGAWIRRGAMALMILAVVVLAHHPVWLGAVFIPLLGLLGLGEGLGSVAFSDIVTRTVPAHRRGRMFGLRMAVGGLLAFGLGLTVRHILSPSFVVPYPYNYTILFAVCLVFLVLSQNCFMRIEEPPIRRRERPAPDFVSFLRRAAALIHGDRNALNYLIYRSVTPAMTMPAAFLVPFAMRQLKFDAGVVGLFVSSAVIASSVSNVWWAWISDRRGNRMLLRLGVATILAALGMLALTPALAEVWGPAARGQLLLWVVVVNALTEVGLTGLVIGQINYNYEIAPPGEVPLYTGLISTSTAPALIVLPPLFGLAAEHYGYPTIFAAGLLAGIVALLLSLRLHEPRHRD